MTIGFVDHYKKNVRIFEYGRFNDADIATWTRQRHTHSTFSGHLWLTLPSLEIIDFTLMSTLADVQKDPEKLGKMIVSHPDDLEEGLAYHPLIVSEGFCILIGAIRFDMP